MDAGIELESSDGAPTSSFSSAAEGNAHGSSSPVFAAPIEDALTCDFGSEWVLPFDKMNDASIKDDVRAALRRGTKVCFCKSSGVKSPPHGNNGNAQLCRSQSTGAWRAQTTLGQDHRDDANCFCIKDI